jgi:hypothetical protein
MGRTKIILDTNSIKKMYIDEHMRAEDIGKIFGVSVKTILQCLRQAGVIIRKRGYGFNIKPQIELTKQQYDFFDGLIVSDGSIYASNSDGRNRNAAISCGFKYKEFADYINAYLCLNGNVHKKIHKSDRYKSGQCVQYGLMSPNNVLFTKERNRWYPNGTKIIPNDFRFSPVSMNIMYLCDGYLIKNSKSYRSVRICTQSFDNDNINIIISNLYDVGIDAHITPDNLIMMNTKNSIRFIEYIGPCPVECYKYKWAI